MNQKTLDGFLGLQEAPHDIYVEDDDRNKKRGRKPVPI